jgi:hypothetical protein
MCGYSIQPKYEIKEYPFGTILARHFMTHEFFEAEWQYQMIKAGNSFAFWYAEEEIERLENKFHTTEKS